jgi:heme iron utilization protein
MSDAAEPRPRAGEPNHAERARSVIEHESAGALATLSCRHPGHPFVSLMPYALDAVGRPLMLVSALAVHTQNLEADPRASLLVTARDDGGEPLAGARVTLLGSAVRLGSDEAADARPRYLSRHPASAGWIDFGDFAFWRLDVDELYFVGGFGAMSWVAAAAYAAVRPA